MSTSAVATHTETSSSSVAILVARVLLSLMFIVAGYGKLVAIGGTAGWFESLGLPAPTLAAIVSGIVELVGGLAILIGYRTRIAALVLAAFTIAATLIAHTNLSDQVQQLFFMKNLAVTGGFLALAASGAGAFSLDARRG